MNAVSKAYADDTGDDRAQCQLREGANVSWAWSQRQVMADYVAEVEREAASGAQLASTDSHDPTRCHLSRTQIISLEEKDVP
jgi:hypothetical protein